MKVSSVLRDAVVEAKKADVYWVEAAKLQFAMGLERQRKSANMTYAAIAQKLGTSAAYITKIFRGDSNVTVESMVKLAHATGGRLDIKIVDEVAAPVHWDFSNIKANTGGTSTRASAVIFKFPEAANHETVALPLVA